MISYIFIVVVALVYALIRAKHDSFIRVGEWKTWAFIEGVMWAVYVVASSLFLFNLQWWFVIVLGPLFAFSFWLVFDCAVGWHFAGSILYLGNHGFDLKMRQTFKYNLPIFGWKESGAFIFILFKLFWIVLLSLIYFELYNG
jgi:hypothetical protein